MKTPVQINTLCILMTTILLFCLTGCQTGLSPSNDTEKPSATISTDLDYFISKMPEWGWEKRNYDDPGFSEFLSPEAANCGIKTVFTKATLVRVRADEILQGQGMQVKLDDRCLDVLLKASASLQIVAQTGWEFDVSQLCGGLGVRSGASLGFPTPGYRMPMVLFVGRDVDSAFMQRAASSLRTATLHQWSGFLTDEGALFSMGARTY